MWKEAMEKRCSRRSYKKEALSVEMLIFLNERIKEYNKLANLHMHFVTNEATAFQGLKKSYGMFKNVEHYIMLICDTKDVYSKEKLGYYGERLVLEATSKGLGTCWVGGTFDRASCPYPLQAHEIIACVIAIGNVDDKLHIKEKIIAKAIHRKSKTIQAMSNANKNSPRWFLQGMEAVKMAPSAVNKQPVTFTLHNNRVTAIVQNHEYLDLGIAMLHFELGAKGGTWTWGNPANYKRNAT